MTFAVSYLSVKNMRKKSKDKVVDGNKMKKLREEQGKSRLMVATKTDVSYNMIWRAENFGSDIPVSSLDKIAKELNTSITELIMPTVTTIS